MAQLNAGRMRISLQCDCAVVATISHLQSCMYAYLSLLVEFLLKQEKPASSSMRHKKSTTLELVVDSLDDVWMKPAWMKILWMEGGDVWWTVGQ